MTALMRLGPIGLANAYVRGFRRDPHRLGNGIGRHDQASDNLSFLDAIVGQAAIERETVAPAADVLHVCQPRNKSIRHGVRLRHVHRYHHAAVCPGSQHWRGLAMRPSVRFRTLVKTFSDGCPYMNGTPALSHRAPSPTTLVGVE